MQAFWGTKALLWDLKGQYNNMYQLHMDDRRTYPFFLEDGWITLFQDIAKELINHPEISGIYGQSWFWGSAIGDISRSSKYLFETPYKGGALFYLLKTSNSGNHIALADKRRKRLFKEGKYIPKNYLIIWPRDALITWYRSSKKHPTAAAIIK